MKIFKWTLTVFLTAGSLFAAAEQTQREADGGLVRQWIKKRRDAQRIEAAAQDVTTKQAIPYLDDAEPLHKLDVYLPKKSGKPFTVLVHIHGGGWKIGDKSLMKATGLFYASQGILFVTPNYRLSPKARHPAHVEDCAAAVAWTFHHAQALGGDTNRVFLSGHSAGAHLAALLATDPVYLKKYGLKPADLAGVIPVDTASFDLTDTGGNERIVERFVRDAFGSDPAVLKSASPFHHLSKDMRYPRFLILNTTNRASAVRAAKRFADALKQTGCEVRFVPVDSHTHTEMAMGMYNRSDPVGHAIFEFLSPAAPDSPAPASSTEH